jgi:hypothetical protein
MIHPPPWLLRALDAPTPEHLRPSTVSSRLHPLAWVLARLSPRPRALALDDARDRLVDGRERVGVELDA